MIIKQKLTTITLLAATLLSSWLYFNLTKTLRPIATTQPQRMNAFAENVTATRFDQNGNLIDQLRAEKLKHYTDDSSDFIKPHLVIYSETAKPWEVDADHGHANNGIKEIELQDSVRLHQSADKNRHEVTITTSAAKIYPEKDYAETDQSVLLQQPGVTLQSVGVRAYLKQGRVELLSKAQGQYEPAVNQENKS